MKRLRCDFISNQRGSVINIALLILLLLTLLGIGFSRNSVTDIKISGNERLRQTALYAADGGTEAGGRLVEENLGCDSGFTPVLGLPYAMIDSNIRVDNLTFSDDSSTTADFTNPDFYYPGTNAITDSGTTLVDVGGAAEATPGGALQMVAGYEGKGRGAATGGGVIIFHINSRHIGNSNSEADVTSQWRHVIGLELECSY